MPCFIKNYLAFLVDFQFEYNRFIYGKTFVFQRFFRNALLTNQINTWSSEETSVSILSVSVICIKSTLLFYVILFNYCLLPL